MSSMRRFLLLLLALAGSACAAFVPPAEGPVPFRRDKLPVDVATMTKLSRQLIVLAGQVEPDKPANGRVVAQMLALSQALDPSNNQVRDLTKQVVEGGEVPRSEEREVNLAQSRAWDLLGWLEQPEAGDDGQALGACLSDVLIVVDSGHPLAKKRAKEGERGAWKEWVAGVEAFGKEEQQVAGTETGKGTDPAMVEEEEPVGEAAKLVLKEVTCSMPIRYFNKEKNESAIRPVRFTLVSQVDSNSKKFVVQLPGEDWNNASKRSHDKLYKFLEARHGSLPEGLSMNLKLSEDLTTNFAGKQKALTGLVTVMANAAFSGVPPTGAVFAAVGDDGSLDGPRRFWETLRALSDAEDNKTSGGRLVLPNSMREYLPPLLTLGKADFFFRYEVLLAEDVDELIAMSSSAPTEDLLEAVNGFAMVSEAKGTRSLGSFVSHSSTQQRLDKIVSLFPKHASARMLALRGTSNWPKRLDRKLYAMELRSALEPMGKALAGRWDSMKVSVLSDAEDKCRERFSEVEKLYGSVADRTELHDPALATAKELSSLVSDIRRMADEQYKASTRVRSTYLEYVDTMTLLTAAVGDKADYPLPDRERSR